MGDFDSSLSLSALLCQENDASYFDHKEEEEEERDNTFNMDIYDGGSDEGYIKELIGKETSFVSRSCVPSFADCSVARWTKCARLDAIDWIFNTRAILGLQLHTTYLSVTYFDWFLSKRSIDDGKLWAIRLLSVACLSLAAKMEESKVPSLSDYPVKDYCFENKVIQRMELLVLTTLEWRMNSITPFAYLQYFANKICCESKTKEIVPKAVELIMEIVKEINLLDYRPSVIAAAAVLAAFNSKFTKTELEPKMNLISSWGSQENEHIFSCYIAMQDIEMGKVKTPKFVISPNSSPIHSSSTNALESSFTSGAGIKRRLIFKDCDQNYPTKKICQR